MPQRNTLKRLVALLARLLGVILSVSALLLIYGLFLNNHVVRGKGFDAPLLDADQLPELAGWVLVAALGGWLFWKGLKTGGSPQEPDPPPDSR